MISTPTALPKDRLRVPEWIRVTLPNSPVFSQTANLIDDLGLHTVCESAKCPNRTECWNRGTATFMIAGDRCTRACGFCAVTTAKPFALEADEPQRVAEAAKRMKLQHVVITGVARDDLADGGANHYAETVRALKRLCGDIIIEVLTSDLGGQRESIQTVLDAQPDVFNHNLETVRRLTPSVRSRATYDRSLEVLAMAKKMDVQTYTKSGIMLGLGETEAEVLEALLDLRRVGCDILTLGQYLQPTLKHLPVREFVPPARFAYLAFLARQLGFVHVASGPMVRSSYHADDFTPARRDRVSGTPPSLAASAQAHRHGGRRSNSSSDSPSPLSSPSEGRGNPDPRPSDKAPSPLAGEGRVRGVVPS
jgi:lipoic acid synthetase